MVLKLTIKVIQILSFQVIYVTLLHKNMTDKERIKIRTLLQALKNRVGYRSLSKDEFLFSKVSKNKYRIRMIKQDKL